MKPNYLLIPLITILVALFGSAFTGPGMDWYDTLIRPNLTPPDWVFPLAWNLIFLLTTISALIIWNKGKEKTRFLWILASGKNTRIYWLIIGLFIANALLNVLWSFLFFKLHFITAAFIEMFFLELTLILLHILTWRFSKLASLLLLPYTLWVGFATYLTWQIVLLNT